MVVYRMMLEFLADMLKDLQVLFADKYTKPNIITFTAAFHVVARGMFLACVLRRACSAPSASMLSQPAELKVWQPSSQDSRFWFVGDRQTPMMRKPQSHVPG
jgi:hypothetical protein